MQDDVEQMTEEVYSEDFSEEESQKLTRKQEVIGTKSRRRATKKFGSSLFHLPASTCVPSQVIVRMSLLCSESYVAENIEHRRGENACKKAHGGRAETRRSKSDHRMQNIIHDTVG